MTPSAITLAVQAFMAASVIGFTAIIVRDLRQALPTIRRIIRQAREQGL